ncbi:MAG: TonB family protein, partial [Rhizomicrobium sp.]|nr:TonB family protein [Rhizomicrobium sp.]
LQRFLAGISPRQRRVLAASGALGCQTVMLTLFFVSAGLTTPKPPAEIELSISGTPGVETPNNKPPEIPPDLPTVTPPEIDLADAIHADAEPAAGLANVTRPAEAIAEAHLFPQAPPTFKSKGPVLVRLLVSISESGMVSSAAVQNSSGIAMLDSLAVEWVKQHWRYHPALRDGAPVAVDTIAMVSFRNG